MEANKRVTGPLLGFLTLILSFIAIASWIFQAKLVFLDMFLARACLTRHFRTPTICGLHEFLH